MKGYQNTGMFKQVNVNHHNTAFRETQKSNQFFQNSKTDQLICRQKTMPAGSLHSLFRKLDIPL